MLVVTGDGKVYYGHIGDSRIYIVANHQIRQLTKDHSFVQTLVDAGEISKNQAEHHPRKNEITNALGLLEMQPPTLCNEPIEPEAGNCFLLCSDGLSGMVDDRHMERVVSKHEINIQQRAKKLVQMANEAGGKDNITVELVEFAVSTKNGGVQNKESNKKLFLSIGVSVIVILAVLVIAYFFVFRKIGTDKNEALETVKIERTDQDETILVSYTKGGDDPIVNAQIPENESIVSIRVIDGEQFITSIRAAKPYIIIRWNDNGFLDTDVSETVIEIALTTNEKKEYNRHIKVIINNDPAVEASQNDENQTEPKALQTNGGLKSGQ
jgi:hypothetical protein